ncbi:MAG: hypothetical protein EP321_00265 [Sphingomonadales bacterium]|nr:MAG: hypothetical protein EP345_12890 [Sphingomonadales bacterium]TNF06316.1 MAG: hypothetical protein EP321_00265 [Sphingomonadales bacterium]
MASNAALVEIPRVVAPEVLTKEILVERARALAPEIAALARETEQARKPLDSVIRKLDEAGLFTPLTPRRWGGPELGLDTQLEIVEIISSACMSTGWVTAFYIGHHIFACRFSEQAQAEIFADGPRCLLPASTSAMMTVKTVPGGWELSGKATWGSGIMHADWVMVGGVAEDGARTFLLPARDVICQDVWHVAGMAGTGSNDIVADKVFVPSHRSELYTDFLDGTTEGARIHDNPMYRGPLMPLIYSEIIGIFSGGLKGAQTNFAETIKKRVITHTGQTVNERPQAHIQVGQSFAALDVAQQLARTIVHRTQELIATGDNALEKRIALKALTGFVTDHCRRSVNEMINRGGSSMFLNERPLQRFFRDINMVAVHAHWDCEIGYEQLGRNFVGLPPTNPLL